MINRQSGGWSSFKPLAASEPQLPSTLSKRRGIGSQKPYLPRMAEEGLYKSINIHSAEYNNPAKLKEKGVKASLLLPAQTPFSAAREN